VMVRNHHIGLVGIEVTELATLSWIPHRNVFGLQLVLNTIKNEMIICKV
jgi:hypothetical protein